VLSITLPLVGLGLSVSRGYITCYNFSKKTRNVLFVSVVEEDLVMIEEAENVLFVNVTEEDLVA